MFDWADQTCWLLLYSFSASRMSMTGISSNGFANSSSFGGRFSLTKRNTVRVSLATFFFLCAYIVRWSVFYSDLAWPLVLVRYCFSILPCIGIIFYEYDECTMARLSIWLFMHHTHTRTHINMSSRPYTRWLETSVLSCTYLSSWTASFFMPALTHFWYRQYWHLLRCRLSIVHWRSSRHA